MSIGCILSFLTLKISFYSGDGPRGGGTGHYNGYGNGDRRRRGGPRKPE